MIILNKNYQLYHPHKIKIKKKQEKSVREENILYLTHMKSCWTSVNINRFIFGNRHDFVACRVIPNTPNLKTYTTKTVTQTIQPHYSLTSSAWALNVCIHFLVATSHTLTVLSELPDTKFLPSGEKATLRTHEACPDKVPTTLECWLKQLSQQNATVYRQDIHIVEF